MRRLPLLLLILLPLAVRAQITAPGITSGARTSGWVAVGINQQYLNRWATNAYVGQSWQSNPDEYNPLRKPAIFILNQETYYSFSKAWQLALCTSYRIQHEFADAPPYAAVEPDFRREVRYYARLFYRHQVGRAAVSHSYRPEFRTFYTPEWEKWESPYQVRIRVKSQMALPINLKGNLSWLMANDILAASSFGADDRWGQFRFTEDRFSTFLRIESKKLRFCLDPGFMYQVWLDGDRKLRHTLYPSIDLILLNPFSRPERRPMPPGGEGD